MESIHIKKNIWNANLYDTNYSFVSKYGNSLAELLAPKQGEKILDLGCGTGDLANTIYEVGADIVGVDKSETMVEQAIRKYPHIQFMVQDATDLDFHSQFDAVFSNAALHWVQPADKALYGINQSLKQGGRFVAEFGGKGNVQMIISEIIQQIKETGLEFSKENFLWFFPSIAEYSTLMEEAGFKVTFAYHFDRPTQLDGENGLKNWIHMFANHLFKGIPEDTKNEIITKVEKNLKERLYKDGNWIADYKRIRVVGMKE